MSTTNTHGLENILSIAHNKNRQSKDQKKIIFHYLQDHIATNSMVSDANGVPQRSICRFKRDLENLGLIYVVEKKFCKLTGFQAWYLTTNPDLFLKSNIKKLGDG